MPIKPRTRQQLIEFLIKHPRHEVANGNSSTYSRCIKLHRLGLTEEQLEACAEMIEMQDSFSESGCMDVLKAFDARHDYEWRIYSTGRSGGHLVLSEGVRGRPEMHSGCGVDCGETFESFSLEDLRTRAAVVRDFDETCDRAVEAFVEFATSHKVVEREVRVTKKVKVIEER